MKIDQMQAMKAIDDFCQDTDPNTVLRVTSKGIFTRTYSLQLVDKTQEMSLLQKFLSLFGASAFNLKNVASIIREVDMNSQDGVNKTYAGKVYEKIDQKLGSENKTQKQQALIKQFDRFFPSNAWRSSDNSPAKIDTIRKPFPARDSSIHIPPARPKPSPASDSSTHIPPARPKPSPASDSSTHIPPAGQISGSLNESSIEYFKLVLERAYLEDCLRDEWPKECKNLDLASTTVEQVIANVKKGLLADPVKPVFKKMIECQIKIKEQGRSLDECKQNAICELLCRSCCKCFFQTVPRGINDGFSGIKTVVEIFKEPAFQKQILDSLQ